MILEVVIEQNAVRRSFGIFELIAFQRPEKCGDADTA
jgi:hypothetical protein